MNTLIAALAVHDQTRSNSVEKQWPLRRWYSPMRARSADEHERVATPLELLFDLCFVVAVSQAAAGLHHSLVVGHIGHGVVGFILVFFAIWWAWMNFTWFASAYDTDDVLYRVTTLVQIAGSLVLAAGVSQAFDGNFAVVTWGYVIMRLALLTQWIRAAAGDPQRRATAIRYLVGIFIVQALWLARLELSESLRLASFLVLVVAEISVPLFAERVAVTTWHPHHIAERYSLFTLIVLGEAVSAATIAIKTAVDSGHSLGGLFRIAGAGIVILFSMWWLYFDQPAHGKLTSARKAFSWGYGHLFIFSAAAAVGVGIEAAVDHALSERELGALPSGMATTIPVGVYVLLVWLLHIGPKNACRTIAIGFPVAAGLVLVASFTSIALYLTAAIMATLVAVVVIATNGEPAY